MTGCTRCLLRALIVLVCGAAVVAEVFGLAFGWVLIERHYGLPSDLAGTGWALSCACVAIVLAWASDWWSA